MYNILIIIVLGLLSLLTIKDVFFNKKHTILHNFPIVGHLRNIFESIGPELRQYWISHNREERPYNRIRRDYVYSSAKKQNTYKGFGSDQDFSKAGGFYIKHSSFPYQVTESHPNHAAKDLIPCAKVMGQHNKRKRPYRSPSIIGISAMSYGSANDRAITALNKGAAKAGVYHNTGEGGVSPYHKNGADLVFQFGTGYFGVRNEKGNFDMPKLVDLVQSTPQIRAIEIKLSQGAKPGMGGFLPGKKVTPEIADIRGIEIGKDCISPAYHTAFSNTSELVDFIEEIAEKTGIPVGIKSAVGKLQMWHELEDIMANNQKVGPDFITIDGAEGGTGAAPSYMADNVALPLMDGFSRVYKMFYERDLTHRIVFNASGKLGYPSEAVKLMAMGADGINVTREFLLALGCIQAQVCHTDKCPSGLLTHNNWLKGGVDVLDKSERVYNYATTLREDILKLTHGCGYEHPCQFDIRDIEVLHKGVLGGTYSDLYQIYNYMKVPVEFNGMKSLL